MNTKKRTITASLLLKSITCLLLAIIISVPINALSDSDLEKFAENNILFYDPDGSGDCNVTMSSTAKPIGSQITWIGDSYSAGAESQITAKFSGVDLHAKASKSFYYDIDGPDSSPSRLATNGNMSVTNPSGITILRNLKENNNLRPVVVFPLGGNDSWYSTSDFASFIDELYLITGNKHSVVLMTLFMPSTNFDNVNAAINKATENYPNILVADWEKAAEGNASSYFSSDQVHPNAAGYDIFVETIFNALPGSADFTSTSDLPSITTEKLKGIDALAESNMERYQYAATNSGLPWSTIAALHYREAGMAADKSILNGQPLAEGGSYQNVDGRTIVSDPNEDALNAANALKDIAQLVYNVTLTSSSGQEDFAKAFLAYNRGFMYKNAQGGEVSYTTSPYVMNYIDMEHIDMVWQRADSYSPSGEKLNDVEGKVNTQVGALAVMTYLSDGQFNFAPTYCSGYGTAGPVVDLNGTNYSWPVPEGGATPGTRDGKSSFCHYNCNSGEKDAADIFASPGSGVVAITGGTLSNVKRNFTSSLGGPRCLEAGMGSEARRDQLQIIGDDGYTYYYTHLTPNSTSSISNGQRVEAGQPLATVGDTRAADCSSPHLHISAVPTGGSAGVDKPWGGYTLAQEILVFLYNNR